MADTLPSHSNLAHRPTPTSPDEEKELAFGQVWQGAANSGNGGQRPGLGDGQNGAGSRRKSSVQFHTMEAEDTIRRESVSQGQKLSTSSRRMSSPPPPSNYQRGVSFDTIDNRDASIESFTLMYKHRDYANTARSRTFLCGTDVKDYSEYALEWMIDELVDDGDEIVCLRVIEKDSKQAEHFNTRYRDEAQKLLDSVIHKNATEEKAISMVMELALGKVQEIFQIMIHLYEPSALVVGTRGRNLGGMQGLLPGSVSKYCLQHSPVPVIVVRPSSKRLKKKKKRQQETGRSLYSNMVEQAQVSGGRYLYDKNVLDKSVSSEATTQEAQAVARAIGAPRRGILKGNYGGPLARVTSNKSDVTSDDDIEVPGERFALPMGFLITEEAPRADEALQDPTLLGLVEDWDDSDEQVNKKFTPKSPPKPTFKPPPPAEVSERKNSDAAISESEDDMLGVPTIVDHRRPSMKETTPWLANILGPSKPTKPVKKVPRTSRSPQR